MSRENDGQNNEGDLVDNSTPRTDMDRSVTLGTPIHSGDITGTPGLSHVSDDAMSAEDEATLALLMGDDAATDLFANLGLNVPTEDPAVVEARAKEQAENTAKARTYDIAAGVVICQASIAALYAQLVDTINVVNTHATFEWNKAILAEKEGQTYEDCLSREALQQLNAVRFIEEAAKDIDKGIALLKVVLLR